jgi:hypothetical protein
VWQKGKCKTEARNESQVFLASVLTRVFAEYNAFKFYCKEVVKTESKIQDVLNNWEFSTVCPTSRSTCFTSIKANSPTPRTPKFSHLVKEGVLHVFLSIKDNLLAIIDAMAPPDYMLDKSDGKMSRCGLERRRFDRISFQLYENLRMAIFHNSANASRPD